MSTKRAQFPTRTGMTFNPAQWDKALSEREREDVLRVFVPRIDGAGDAHWVRRADRTITDNEAARANKALNKLQNAPELVRSRKHGGKQVPLPKAPEGGALRLWHLHQRGWTFDQLAADDSPVLDYLTRSPKSAAKSDNRFDNRKRAAFKINEKVERFHEAAPDFWFYMNLYAATASNWPYESALPPTKHKRRA